MFKKVLTAGIITVCGISFLVLSNIGRAGAEEPDTQEIAEEIQEVLEEEELTEEIDIEESAETEEETPEEAADEMEEVSADSIEEEFQDEAEEEQEDGERREVSDWSEFQAAIADTEVSEIVFLNNIQRAGNSAATNLGAVNRNLKIDGNNYSLIIASGHSTANSSLTLAAAEATLEVRDLQYKKTFGPDVALFNQSSASASAGWNIKIHNVSSASDNAAALINAEQADIEISGMTDIRTTGKADIIKGNNITVKRNTQFSAENSNSSTTASGIMAAGGNLVFEELTVVTAVGTRRGHIFSANKILLEAGTKVETSFGNADSNHASYYAKEVIVRENAALTSVTNGNAYGISTGNFIVHPGADVELSATGTANAAVYIRETGSVEITKAALTIKNAGTTTTSSSHTGSGGMYGAMEDVIFKNAEVDIETTADCLVITENSKIAISEESKVVLNSLKRTGIEMNTGSNSKKQENHIAVDGEGTSLEIYCADTRTSYEGAAVYVKGDNSTLDVLNGAKFYVHADNGTTNGNSAVQIQGAGAKLNVHNKAEMRLWAAKSTAATSPILRFRLEGGMTLDIDDAEVYLESAGGSANGIRLYGGDNAVKVRNGGYLYIHNPGSGSRTNHGTNAGIRYHAGGSSKPDTFMLEGENADGTGSTVEIVSDSGAAIYSGSSSPIEIKAGKNTIFELTGNTSSGSNGVINLTSGALTFDINEPAYFDFKNKNYATPAISTGSSSSVFNAKNTAISFWRKGSDWTKSPTKNIRWMEFMTLSKANLGTIGDVDPVVSAEFHAEYGGNNMLSYNRISSNNARAVVDELRIGTDADQRIYGHVMVPEGRTQELRDAYTDEVFVIAEVLDAETGESVHGELKGTTRGMGDSETGINAFGLDGERGGMFEIELPDGAFLEEGQIVQVVGAWRGNDAASWADAVADTGNIISRDEKDIRVEAVTTQKVVPPAALGVENVNAALLSEVEDSDEKVLSTRTTKLNGTAATPGAAIYLYKNGELLVDGTDTVAADGSWEVVFPAGTVLEANDVIGIALNDKHQAVTLTDTDASFLQSRTRMNNGNENPASDLAFHDLKFAKRLYLRVEPVGELQLYAPAEMSFGKHGINPIDKKYKVTGIDTEELGVLDTRLYKNPWSLYLTMDKQMTHKKMKGTNLADALRYVKNGEEKILTEGTALLIMEGQNENHEDFYDLYSDHWYGNTGDGLWMHIKGGLGRTGAYEGRLTWTLVDAPGND